MKRVFQVISLFAFWYSSTSLIADEPSAKQPAALKELLKHRSGKVKWTAAEALWKLEHKGTELAPIYAELLTATEVEVRAASAWRLGRLGNDARPAVLALAATLRDESFEVRFQAGQALANLGPIAEPALPALVRALGDTHLDESRQPNIGWEGARTSPALPALVELADASIPLLIETFRERATKRESADDSSEPRDWEVASRVAFAFPAFGGRAVPPLLQALDSKVAEKRAYAALALREVARLNGLPEAAIAKVEKALDDSDKDVRRRAAQTMTWVRPSNTKAVTILVGARKDLHIFTADLLADLERMSPHNEEARKVLFQFLADNDAETAREAYRILARFELSVDQMLYMWTPALSHVDKEVRSKAISALGNLGPRAKLVLQERLKNENDYYNKGAILDSLAAIDPDGPALVPLFVKYLDDPESWVRWRAINVLASLGPRAKDALPALEARLFNPGKKEKEIFLDSETPRALVDGIVRIAPGSAKSAHILLKALRDPGIRAVHCPKNTWYMRDLLEDALQANLPASAPVLRDALKDKEFEVRTSAALVLVRAGRETETALPVLMDKLWIETDRNDESSRFQRHVVELLIRRRRSPVTPAVAAAWCQAWQAGNPKVREILEPGLIVLQPEALPHLLQQLRQAKTVPARRDLAHLLARFEGQGKVVLPILRKELAETEPAPQYAAAQALMVLGPDAADAVPELLKLLSNPHPGMRALAAQTLAGIGRPARPAVPALKAMLKEPNSDLRLIAASALSQIDPDATEALTLLRDVLARQKAAIVWRSASIEFPKGVNDGSGIFPEFVEYGIVRFGERSVSVLADLLDNVDLDEWSAENLSAQCGSHARIQAALLLARLGPDAKAAVPALTRALKDKDPFIRDAAASALGRIGPAAKQAVPDVIALLERANRSASAAGTWSSTPQTAGRARAANRFDYGGPFDFRSAGRQRVLSRDMNFGYYGYHDPYAGVRPTDPYDPAYVLGRIDSETRSAQPILNAIAKDPNHPGRLSAALAMWRNGCDSPDLIPAFSAALEAHGKLAKNEQIPLAREIRECLAELYTLLKPAARVMAEWLKQRQSADLADQVAVLEALGRLGENARAESDVIRPMLEGGRWVARRRVAAALALFQIHGDKDLALSVLREVLLELEVHESIYYSPDMTDTARVHAARALGALVENGDERAKALIVESAKGDENLFVRVAALEVMAGQEQTNEAAMKGLCAMLRHPTATVRAEAASACGRLGPRAKSSLEALKAAKEDGHLAVRRAAKQALEFVH